MDDGWHYMELSCGVGSQIKESTRWHCFRLFINQIHHNVCVCVWEEEKGAVGEQEEDR